MSVVTWKSSDVVKALRVKGYSVTQIAEEVGLSFAATRYSLRTGNSEKVREKVSSILSIPAWELWPMRYPPQWREFGPPIQNKE